MNIDSDGYYMFSDRRESIFNNEISYNNTFSKIGIAPCDYVFRDKIMFALINYIMKKRLQLLYAIRTSEIPMGWNLQFLMP